MLPDEMIAVERFFTSSHPIEALIPEPLFSNGEDALFESIYFCKRYRCLKISCESKSSHPIEHRSETVFFTAVDATAPNKYGRKIVFPMISGVGFEHEVWHRGDASGFRLEKIRIYSQSNEMMLSVALSYAFVLLQVQFV